LKREGRGGGGGTSTSFGTARIWSRSAKHKRAFSAACATAELRAEEFQSRMDARRNSKFELTELTAATHLLTELGPARGGGVSFHTGQLMLLTTTPPPPHLWPWRC
jgi:hypothetical protein